MRIFMLRVMRVIVAIAAAVVSVLSAAANASETPALAPLENVASEACTSCHTGTDAHTDHSTAVDYSSRLLFSTARLRRPTAPSGFGATVAADFLISGKVECTSCHSSHQTPTDQKHRLRTSSATAMCRACHSVE